MWTAQVPQPGWQPQRTTMIMTTDEGVSIPCQPDPFARGAEGRLYLSRDGRQVIKVYTHPSDWRRAALNAILRKRGTVMGRQRLYWSSLLCWPEHLVLTPGLGVVMPRAPENLRPFEHLLLPRYRQLIAAKEGTAALGTWDAHIELLAKLARAVRQLHANTICHTDLSANNLLVDPALGQALLIDCDGLVIPGSRVLRRSVLGTLDYMAPELVREMDSTNTPQPTLETDRHALAVLIYRGLLFRHPLRGRAIHSDDPDIDDRLALGEKALFIEHPTDTRNHPSKPFLTSAILGREMARLMQRAFVDGLHTPALRPTAAEWERALVRLHDQTLHCSNPACEAKAFVFGYGKTSAWDCPWCGSLLAGPAYLPMLIHYKPTGEPGRMGLDFQVIGWPQRPLHAWHIQVDCLPGPDSATKVFAVCGWDPATKTWQLKNKAIPDLGVVDGGHHVPVAVGEAVILKEGLQLHCGTADQWRVIVVRMHQR